jgi:hypothetical protein
MAHGVPGYLWNGLPYSTKCAIGNAAHRAAASHRQTMNEQERLADALRRVTEASSIHAAKSIAHEALGDGAKLAKTGYDGGPVYKTTKHYRPERRWCSFRKDYFDYYDPSIIRLK